jgi:hypothetical protein
MSSNKKRRSKHKIQQFNNTKTIIIGHHSIRASYCVLNWCRRRLGALWSRLLNRHRRGRRQSSGRRSAHHYLTRTQPQKSTRHASLICNYSLARPFIHALKRSEFLRDRLASRHPHHHREEWSASSLKRGHNSEVFNIN